MMSIHRPDSELSRVNAEAKQGPITLSSELFRVIAQAQAIAAETDGSFDVTIRPVADLWGFIQKSYRLPSPEALRAAMAAVGHRHLELDTTHRTLRFRHPGVSIDLGGIGKGVAVDMAIETLRGHGITNAMVKAGGDLRVMGKPPEGEDWLVQLEDPRKRGNRISVRLRDAALSTSGNYENFFEIDGVRYSHILDPRTGQPVQGMAACTVIAPTCTESDAWATACFVRGVEASLSGLGRRYAIRFTLADSISEPRTEGMVKETRDFPATPWSTR